MKIKLTNNEPLQINALINNTPKVIDVVSDIEGKQDTLVSGTNIKTVNNESLLGSGNVDVNPIIFIDYWGTSIPLSATTGQYWWDASNTVLKVYNGSNWERVTLDTKKLYIKTPDNTIYRYDRGMV